MTKGYINFTPTYYGAIATIILAPLIWNIVARSIRPFALKQKRQTQYYLCYALTVWIFSFSSFRDYLYVTRENYRGMDREMQTVFAELVADLSLLNLIFGFGSVFIKPSPLNNLPLLSSLLLSSKLLELL